MFSLKKLKKNEYCKKKKKDCHKNEAFNRAYTQNPFYISFNF